MCFYLGYAVLLLFCFYSFPMVIFSWLSQSNRWLTINPCTLVAHLVKNPPAMWETWVWSLVWKIPWRREWLLTPVLWPGKFQLQRVGHDWAIFTFHCFCAYENSIVLLTQERPSLVAQWLKKKKICLQCRRPGFSPGFGRSPGEGNGYPLQYSCLENRGANGATVHGVTKSQTWLSN